MDIAWNLLDNHRTRPSWRRCWWNIKHHCRRLCADRGYFVHNQPLAPIQSRALSPAKILCSRLNFASYLTIAPKGGIGVQKTLENPSCVTRVFRRKVLLFELIILALTVQWLLSFFGQSIFPGFSHTGGFIYMLSALIVVLIIINSLT